MIPSTKYNDLIVLNLVSFQVFDIQVNFARHVSKKECRVFIVGSTALFIY